MRYFASYIALILARQVQEASPRLKCPSPDDRDFGQKPVLIHEVCRPPAHNGIVWSLNIHEIDHYHERPYDRENTASRLICEVKHVPVWIVVRWGTTREV